MRSLFERSRARQLAEVKAILHRLQALSAESSVDLPAGDWAKRTYPGRVAVRRALAAGMGLIGGLAVGAYVFHGFGGPASLSLGQQATGSSEGYTFPTIPDQPPTDKLEQSAQSILDKASQDMAAGRVRAAREALIRIQHQGSADMAWALARSYDPNFLAEIADRDAEPDATEAVRWYRVWYSRAVADGLVADSVPLERIIRSMVDAPPVMK